MGMMFRNRFKENFDFKNEEYNPMPVKDAEIGNEIYPDIPEEFPGTHIGRDNEVGDIEDLQSDDDSNIEAAEADKNCDLTKIPVAIGRELDQQTMR